MEWTRATSRSQTGPDYTIVPSRTTMGLTTTRGEFTPVYKGQGAELILIAGGFNLTNFFRSFHLLTVSIMFMLRLLILYVVYCCASYRLFLNIVDKVDLITRLCGHFCFLPISACTGHPTSSSSSHSYACNCSICRGARHHEYIFSRQNNLNESRSRRMGSLECHF